MLDPHVAIKLIQDFLNSPRFLALQIIGGIFSLIFLIASIILIKKAKAFTRHMGHLLAGWRKTPISLDMVEKRWRRIEGAIKKGESPAWRAAIIDADLLLEELLKTVGYEGNTIDERLSNIKTPWQFPTLDDAWRAHKIRVFLEQDPAYPLSREVAEQTVGIYKKIFVDMGAIE